jgi:polysaccharide biosynthesis protein PslG
MHAVAQGLEVVARLGFVPEWARQKDTSSSYLDRDHYADFGDYVYAFVKHFAGRIRTVVLWNEPNLTTEWGNRPPDPAAYTELLRIAYQRAKEANPAVVVLGGALAPTLEAPGSPAGVSDLWYLREMYKGGAASWFDALAIHAYGWAFAPEDEPAADRVNYRRPELIREIMVEFGDSAKTCLITEAGWNDYPRWTKSVSVSTRAQYTVDAYRLARTSWPWCQAVCMWALRFPRPQRTYQDGFSFVSSDFRARPVYSAVQRYTQGEP